MNKTLATFIGICVVVLIGGLIYGFYFYEQNYISSKQFNGSVQKVEGSTIRASGSYMYEKDGKLIASEEKNVSITVMDNTEFVRVATIMPTQAELAASGGKFDFAKLKKENQPGKISDLTDNVQNQPIVVYADENIYEKGKFAAKKIEYTQIVYPDINMEEED